MCKICSELTIKHRNDIDDVVLMFLLLALLLTDFTHCSLVSIVNFEQINASWSNALGILYFIYGSCLSNVNSLWINLCWVEAVVHRCSSK